MKNKNYLIVLLLLVFIISCTRQVFVTKYYLLEYQPTAKNEKLLLEKPIPGRVQVGNFNIPRSYDSIRIIARFSSHQINYYRYSLWAVRPQMAIADELVKHVNVYQIFLDCKREFLDSRPDYEITGQIHQIERFDSEGYSAAHLKMTFYFYNYESKDVLVSHSFDREVPITAGSMTIFAKVISDIAEEEVENFLIKVVEYFYPPEVDSTQVIK
ncbi:ABC-type transport auxiliary lipoprotein family protein [bacterium]|nr:ABC-type transport auxiliary lipoprotein family protein [bacterium]